MREAKENNLKHIYEHSERHILQAEISLWNVFKFCVSSESVCVTRIFTKK